MDGHRAPLDELTLFLLEYAGALLAAGVHTARCVRSVNRIAEAYGYRAAMIVSQKNVSMSLVDCSEPLLRQTSVHRLRPIVFNFSRIGLLSALTWRAMDDRLPLEALRREFHLIMAMGTRPLWVVSLSVAAANAAFCRLFGGDAAAMALVFAGTLLGFLLRHGLARCRLNHYGSVAICAFVSGMVAALGTCCGWGSTPEIALATSVLYLVPGVQIINSLMDLINGYALNSYQRGIASLVTIICLAVALALTMLVVGVDAFAYL